MKKRHKKKNFQRNKYLDELGLSIQDYGINFCDSSKDTRKRKWRRQRERYGFDDREIWNLDRTMAEWLYSHLMMYKEIGLKHIDGTYHKYEFKGKIYTLNEAVDFIIEAMKKYILADYYPNKIRECMSDAEDAFKLLGIIFPSLWW